MNGRVCELLGEASRLVLSSNSSASASSSFANSNTPTNSRTSANSATLAETLSRTRGMLRESTSLGMFRQLNRQERLRAVSGSSYQQAKPAKEKPRKEKKATEFALLRCWDEDELEEPHNLKWDSIIATGMLMLQDDDDESTIRNAIKESLCVKLLSIGANDFDFVKVRHKTVTTLQMGPGTEYNYPVVKKMAGQGLLYVKVKQGYEFAYKTDAESDEELSNSAFDCTHPKKTEHDDLPATKGSCTVTLPSEEQNVTPEVIEIQQDLRQNLPKTSDGHTADTDIPTMECTEVKPEIPEIPGMYHV